MLSALIDLDNFVDKTSSMVPVWLLSDPILQVFGSYRGGSISAGDVGIVWITGDAVSFLRWRYPFQSGDT